MSPNVKRTGQTPMTRRSNTGTTVPQRTDFTRYKLLTKLHDTLQFLKIIPNYKHNRIKLNMSTMPLTQYQLTP